MNMPELGQSDLKLSRQQLTAILQNGIVLEQKVLRLQVGRCNVLVRSNSIPLLSRLESYFSHIVLLNNSNNIDIEVLAIEQPGISLSLDFKDWQREYGKTGRKDSIYDVDGARIIFKVRTGMLFLQSQDTRIAAGPCLENDNQVINFIVNQYMTWLQQRDWQNCHAAAIVKEGQAYAIAGFSGGGKSTLMLQMLEDSATQFLTNDRLFIHAEDNHLMAAGVPKMPRINPGTIINNPRLCHLISPDEQSRLRALDPEALWDLEQKYDVDITADYGVGRIAAEAPLKSFLVLNWQRDTNESLALKKINLRERPDLLLAIMKAPGPFYQKANGTFSQDSHTFNEAAYLDALALVNVYEATGQVNFKQLSEHYLMQKVI